MQTLAGPSSKVYFTHVSSSSKASLETLFSTTDSASGEEGKDGAQVSAWTQGVQEVMKQEGVSLEKVCLLDPRAEKELAPEDGDGRFEWFLFGVRPSVVHLYVFVC